MNDEKLLIITEGVTDTSFFKVLIESLKCPKNIIKVDERGGKDKKLLMRYLKENLTQYPKISKILIINDDDGDPKGTESSILDILTSTQMQDSNVNKIFQNVERQILLIPDNLEALLLRIVKYPQINSCIENFLSCLQSQKINDIAKKEAKTRFFSYLAAMREPTNKWKEPFIYHQFFDLQHSELNFVRDKIYNLVN